MHGFTEDAIKVVRDCNVLKMIVSVANKKLYNFRNNVQVYHIDGGMLYQEKKLQPSHISLMDFDTGADAVEVIKRSDFYSQVLKDLGL